MSTSIEIWNSAMLKIGGDRITAAGLDPEAQLEAALASTTYQNDKESFLSSYEWNAAIKRATLALSTEVPANQFAYAFALPTDCLRPVEARNGRMPLWNLNGEGVRAYTIEGRFILTNETGVILRYVANIDESLFTPNMEETLIAKICSENIYSIGQSNAAMDRFEARYARKLEEARIVDSLENPHVVTHTSQMRDVRY